MSSLFSGIKRKTLERSMAQLVAEFEAANEQLMSTLDEVDRIRIKRRVEGLEAEIKDLEGQIQELATPAASIPSSPPGSSIATPTIPTPSPPPPSTPGHAGYEKGCAGTLGGLGFKVRVWYRQLPAEAKAAVIMATSAILVAFCGLTGALGAPVVQEVAQRLLNPPAETPNFMPTPTWVAAMNDTPSSTSVPSLTSTLATDTPTSTSVPSPTSTLATDTPSPTSVPSPTSTLVPTGVTPELTPTPIVCGTPHPPIATSGPAGEVEITAPTGDCVAVGRRETIEVAWSGVSATGPLTMWILVYSPVIERYYPRRCTQILQASSSQSCPVYFGSREPYEVVAVLADQDADAVLQQFAKQGTGIVQPDLPEGLAEKDSLSVVCTE